MDALPIIRKQIPNISLWIVGDFDSQKEHYLNIIANHNLQNNIRLVEGYVPDCEVEKYFAASDLIVLPYTSATQSGIVQIAYGFEKPVVVTSVGGLPDVVENGKTGYVVPCYNPDAIAEAVIHFFRADTHIDWETNIKNKAQQFSWETMVSRIENLLQ